jgi:hypothetical protein
MRSEGDASVADNPVGFKQVLQPMNEDHFYIAVTMESFTICMLASAVEKLALC